MSDKISNQNKAENTHNCIFSNEKANMGHQSEFDYFKAFLISFQPTQQRGRKRLRRQQTCHKINKIT